MDSLTTAQRNMLTRLTEILPTWNVILLASAPGDAAFLAPICPSLEGIEICADVSDCVPTGLYNIWRDGKLIKTGLRAKLVARWIKNRSPSEDEFIALGTEWIEAAMKRYCVPTGFDVRFFDPYQNGINHLETEPSYIHCGRGVDSSA